MPLMTYDQYEALDPRPKKPYTFSIHLNQNALYYFGEGHSFDPNNPQWIEEKVFWRSFLKGTEGQKRIVLIEGGMRPLETIEEEQVIVKHGGMGLMRYLAHQEGIDVYSPEPDAIYERTELLKQFSSEEIQYYYFARVVFQWNRKQEPKPDFEQYVTNSLEMDKKESGWKKFDFSLESMKKIHATLFNKEFDKNDNEFFYNITTPVQLKTVINKVSRASTEIRDKYIVEQIQKYINEGHSIYIQFGYTHAVMQEPLLREILKVV